MAKPECPVHDQLDKVSLQRPNHNPLLAVRGCCLSEARFKVILPAHRFCICVFVGDSWLLGSDGKQLYAQSSVRIQAALFSFV